MALERLGAQHMAVVDKYHEPIVDYEMTTQDYVVRPDAATPNAGDILISLPPVSLAKGRFYSILAKGADNTNFITIQDHHSGLLGVGVGDSENWQGDVILNEAGRGQVFYSDGQCWITESFGDIHFTSSLAAGAVNLREVHLTMDTAGLATVDAFVARLESDVMLGNSAGAVFAQTNFDASAAGVGGLAYAVCAEMRLPNNAAIASGHYVCLDFEMGMGALTDWAGGTKVSYMRFDDWGHADAFAASAFFFTLAGVRLGGNMISLTCHTIKMQFETDALKTRYLVCSEAEDVIKLGGVLAYEMISAVYQLDLNCNITAGHADDDDGWFVQQWNSVTLGAAVAFTATAQVFCIHTYLNWAGAGTWGGSGTCCPIVGHYQTTGANVVVVSDGFHGGGVFSLVLGSGFEQELTADVAGIRITTNINAGATFSTPGLAAHSQMLSAINICKATGASQVFGTVIKMGPNEVAQQFLMAWDGTMVSKAGNSATVGDPDGYIKINIDGEQHYIWTWTNIA